MDPRDTSDDILRRMHEAWRTRTPAQRVQRAASLTIVLLGHFGCYARSTSDLPSGATTEAATETGSDSATAVPATDSSDTSGATTESMAIDEAFCEQFETEQACAAATPSDAPLQCLYYDSAWPSFRLIQTTEGPACIPFGIDYANLGCHVVEYTPSACDLTPPLEATEACGTSEPPWLFYEVSATGEEWAEQFALPCHFRPPGYQACWESPAPACWCSCHPTASCEDALEYGALCEPNDTGDSESSTGTGADSGTSTGTTGTGTTN